MPVRIPVDEYTRWCLLRLVECSMMGARIRVQVTNVFKVRYAEALQERQLLVVHRYAAEAVARGGEDGGATNRARPPLQNGYVGSFNGKLHCEFLKFEICAYLLEAKSLATYRRHECNHERPHARRDEAGGLRADRGLVPANENPRLTRLSRPRYMRGALERRIGSSRVSTGL